MAEQTCSDGDIAAAFTFRFYDVCLHGTLTNVCFIGLHSEAVQTIPREDTLSHLAELLVDDTKLEGVVHFVLVVAYDQLRPLEGDKTTWRRRSRRMRKKKKKMKTLS